MNKRTILRIMNKKWPGYVGRIFQRYTKYICIFNRESSKEKKKVAHAVCCMLYVTGWYGNGTNYEHTKLCSCIPMMIKLQYFPSLLYTHVQTIIEFMGY